MGYFSVFASHRVVSIYLDGVSILAIRGADQKSGGLTHIKIFRVGIWPFWMRVSLRYRRMIFVLAYSLGLMMPGWLWAQQQAGEASQVMEGFNKLELAESRTNELTTKDKHRVMFIMGVTLLVLVLLTAGLGIALGVFGKAVFVAHMISAGLSVTLAIAHSIVAIVWFYPF